MDQRLKDIVYGNSICEYEEVNNVFISVKLCQLSNKLSIVIRSDVIVPLTYWIIRYYRHYGIEPKAILTTELNKELDNIMGIKLISKKNLNQENTTNIILMIINRETDYQNLQTQDDYREDSYSFALRYRVNLQHIQNRTLENFPYIIKHEQDYNKLLEEVEDKESQETLLELLRCLVENDIYKGKEYNPQLKYFDFSLYTPSANSAWINLGACTGDTILKAPPIFSLQQMLCYRAK